MKTRLLVIGYGNELRRDDGVGPRVARMVSSWNRSGLKAVACHQLMPELAQLVADADCVVFVDASLEGGDKVALQRLEAVSVGADWGHRGDPSELLAQTQALYGRRPSAWMLAIPVKDVHFGDELSVVAQCGLQAALGQIRVMVDNDRPSAECQLCTKSV